jgi:hypothetical protein
MGIRRCSAWSQGFVSTALVASQVLSAFGPRVGQSRQAPDPLARLTAPAEVLPSGCRLTPTGPFGSNPAVTTDAKALLLIYGWVIGETQPATGRDHPPAVAERWTNEAVARVDAGYAAFYREEGGSPQIGVYGLRLKNPPGAIEAERFRALKGAGGPTALRRVVGSVMIFAWSNGRPDAPDRGCWDVVRRHLEQVDLR